MSWIWIALAALITAEALVTLRGVYRFRAFFLREAAIDPPKSMQMPKVAILAPCKGLDERLAANIASWRAQDYPDFSIFFIVESEEDPALTVLRAVPGATVVVAGRSTDCGQKIHNLRFAISQLPAEYEILAFVDSDAQARPGWLKALVGKLIEHPEDAATGYRWFTPAGSGPAGMLRAAWNASVLTLYEKSGKKNFAWGGSMALWRKTFQDAGVLRFWEGSLSDDYALTNAMRASGRRVLFVPRAMALTSDRIGVREFFAWAGRQLLITRLYFPHLWRMAFGFHVLWILWVILGICFQPLWFLASFAFVQTLQGIKANLRFECARAVLSGDAGNAGVFWIMSPIIGIANFVMMAGNLLTRRVRWRGVEYEVLGPNKLRRIV